MDGPKTILKSEQEKIMYLDSFSKNTSRIVCNCWTFFFVIQKIFKMWIRIINLFTYLIYAKSQNGKWQIGLFSEDIFIFHEKLILDYYKNKFCGKQIVSRIFC